MAESIMELAVKITALDFFTGPLRSMVSQVATADSKFKSITSTMKMMGKSKSEIDAINSSLQKMKDQQAFANVASDLQKIGMAREDIAAMETSYMRMAQYQRDIASAQERIAAGKEMVASGVGNLTTAAIGGFGIMEMVKQAGEYQSNLATIQDTTGATNKQMQDFSNSIMNASAQVSKFNDFQMTQIAQTLTSGGFSNVKQAQSLLLPVAKFAEVQGYENKQSDPIEATKQAIEMAHIFKTYDPKSFGNFLDTFNKYSMMQPGDSSSLVQTLTYLAPKAQTLGMSQSDIMALSAVANRVGLTGSHGGTNAADMILRLIPGLVGGGPTKKGTPKAWAAMEQLGFVDKNGNSPFFDKNGKIINLNGMLTTMINDGKKLNPKQLTQAYHDIFGAQGGNAASILANPTTLEQLGKMRAQLGQTNSLDKIHSDHQNTAAGQINLLKSNSMTLMLRVGQQLAVSLNPAIKSINDMLGKLLAFSQAHPGVAKIIGDFALLAVGGKAVEGVFKIIKGNVMMLDGAFKILRIKNEAGEIMGLGKILKNLLPDFNLVKTGVKMFGSSFAGGLKTAMEAVKLFGSTTLTILKDFGSGILSLGKTIATWAIETAGEWLIAMGPVGWIIAGVTAVIAAGVAAWMTNFFGFRDKITALWDWIKGHWKQLAIAAINPVGAVIELVLAALPAKWKQAGIDMMNGLINGVKSMAGAVGNTIKGIGSGIVSGFKKLLGINSPSRVFMEHGKYIVQGLALGIDQNVALANRSTSNLANGVVNGFRPSINGTGTMALASTGGAMINIHPGAIVIQGGNASAQEIAQMVLVKLGQASRQNLMNTGSSLNISAF